MFSNKLWCLSEKALLLSYVFSLASSVDGLTMLGFPRQPGDKPCYQGVWSTRSGYTAAAGSSLKTKGIVGEHTVRRTQDETLSFHSEWLKHNQHKQVMFTVIKVHK